ncbi:hypothetical protein [Oceanithermus sp.]
MKRVLLALVFLLPLARAAGCKDYDVVLEIEKPAAVLAGAEFELDGEKMVFSGGACLDFEGSFLQTDRIVYDRREHLLRATNVSGSVSGWRVSAPLLTGDAETTSFKEPVFERGDTVVTAAAAAVKDSGLELEDLLATTSRYRFRAARGWINDDVFKAERVWSTPCKCGNAIEITAAEAEFAFAAGKLYLRQAEFRLYGIDLSRSRELLVEPEKEMRLEFPLRFSYGGGWNFGVENLPLPAPGEAFGRWSTHLTALASGIGGPLYEGKTESLTLRLDYAGSDGSLRFGLKPVRRWDGAAWENWLEPYVRLRKKPLSFGIGWDNKARTSTGYFLISDDLDLAPLSLSPYLRLAREAANSGLSAGLSGKLETKANLGGWRFSVAAPFVLAAYPDAPVYAWGGGQLEADYGDLISFKAGLYGAYGTPRYSYEARGDRQEVELRIGKKFWASAAYRQGASYDLAAGAVSGYSMSFKAALGWKQGGEAASLSWSRTLKLDANRVYLKGSERWLLGASVAGQQLKGEWNRRWDSGGNPTRSEVWLSYQPPLPDCAGGWRLSPSIGYDLLGGGVSRVGLDFEFNDCCFKWRLGYRGVLSPSAAGLAEGHNVTFGVSIRQ